MPVRYSDISAGPSTRRALAAAEDATVDYASFTKAQLVELAEERGVDSSGTKSDLVERLSE